MELTINLNNIRDLFGSRPKVIPVIPTASVRKRLATGILNSLVDAHPEYLPALHVLTCYPILRWALDHRSACFSALREETGTDPRPCAEREGIFPLYEEITGVLERSMEKLKDLPKTGRKLFRTIADIHCSGDADAVSLYQLNLYYRDAAEFICRDCGSELSLLKEKLNLLTAPDYMEQTGMTNPALVRVRSLTDRFPILDADMQGLVRELVRSLADHPKDAAPMISVLDSILNGNTTVEDLRGNVDYSWNTIARYRTEAYHAMACLLWGYSIEEIIFGLWEAQIEEQES